MITTRLSEVLACSGVLFFLLSLFLSKCSCSCMPDSFYMGIVLTTHTYLDLSESSCTWLLWNSVKDFLVISVFCMTVTCFYFKLAPMLLFFSWLNERQIYPKSLHHLCQQLLSNIPFCANVFNAFVVLHKYRG